MGENQLWRLADELSAELDEFLKLKNEIDDAQRQFADQDPNTFELRALGSILHDIYHNVETICTRVVKEIDQRVLIGADWHRLLLDEMTKSIPNTRPAVIRPETAALLDEYRRFRHLFRHIYGFRLDWTLMKPLLDNGVTAIDIFAADVRQFIAFLRLISDSSE